MFLMKLKLVNFESIYNGTGKKEIEIDFPTNCKFFRIDGVNGSGKTSILNNAQPKSRSLTAHSSKILNGEEGFKELTYINDGIIYIISHHYKPNKNKSHSIKSFITRVINGISEELNPSGNVTQFNEVLEDVFMLSKDFLSLMNLGINSRGFVTQTASERKKFITPMIQSSAELVKKYNERKTKLKDTKSSFNIYTSKLEKLGDIDNDRLELESLYKRLDNYQVQYNEVSNKKYLLESDKNNIIDKLQSYNKRSDIINNIDKLTNKCNKFSSCDTIEYHTKRINEDTIELQQNATLIMDIKNNISLFRDQRMELKNRKMELVNSIDPNYVETDLNKLYDIRDKLIYDISEFESNTDISIDSEECQLIYDKICNLQNMLDNAYIDPLLNTAMELYRDDYQLLQTHYNDIRMDITGYETQLASIRESNNMNINNIDSIISLKSCNDTKCPVISKLIEISEHDSSGIKMNNINESLKKAFDELTRLGELMPVVRNISDIYNFIQINTPYFQKVPNLIDKISDVDNLLLHTKLKDLSDLNDLMEYSTRKETYVTNKDQLVELKETIYKTSNDKQTHDKINDNLYKLNKSIQASIFNETMSTRRLKKYTDIETNITDRINDNNFKLSLLNDKSIIMEDINKFSVMLTEYDNLKENLMSIDNNLTIMNAELIEFTKNISTTNSTIKALENKIYMYDDYKSNIDALEEEYRYRTCIDASLSPTKGIPLLPMEKFLDDIQVSVNGIINSMFPSISLDSFVIDGSEFRIPYVTNNGYSEDISTSSGGESSIISLAFTLTFLMINSPIYNIPLFDEIDATLDRNNRMRFIDILDNVTHELGIEQILVISHNDAYDNLNVGIISLSPNIDLDESKIIYKTY